MIAWRLWAATQKGLVREENEDWYGASGLIGTAGDGEVLTAEGVGTICLAVVADGLGGHPAGEVASRLAGEHVLARRPADVHGLVEAIQSANDVVYDSMADQPELRGMGTTLASLLASRDGIAVANVGDSAVFELVDGHLVKLTVDDVPAGSSSLPGVPSGLLTQTLGGSSSPVPVRPHVYDDSRPGERRFLVCTDGLTNFVPTGDLTDALAEPDGREAVSSLLARTLDAGAPDNVTVTVVETSLRGHR